MSDKNNSIINSLTLIAAGTGLLLLSKKSMAASLEFGGAGSADNGWFARVGIGDGGRICAAWSAIGSVRSR